VSATIAAVSLTKAPCHTLTDAATTITVAVTAAVTSKLK
jgi:hypothetical protein